MKVIKNLFIVVISIILLSATALAVSENNINTKNVNAPVADFYIIPSSTIPLKVTFMDQSTGSPTFWYWNFGDNSTSTVQNPMHTYVTEGKYTVNLTVKRAAYINTKTIILSF
jgi:PKD repeat protein